MTDYRSDFPLLTSRGFRKDVGMEHDWIYIDNAATSQRPQAVLDAEEEFYKEHNANPLRGNYPLSIEATQMYEDARKAVRDFIGAKSVREIIFTRNTTESINLVAYSYGLSHGASQQPASLADGGKNNRRGIAVHGVSAGWFP